MNIRATLTGTLALAVIGLIADAAMAKTIPIKGNSQSSVQSKCDGVFWIQGKTGHTYGCLNDDGSGIVCGGVTTAQKKTCDTFRRAPRQLQLPTREEAAKAEKE
jgi:hypothetical protein